LSNLLRTFCGRTAGQGGQVSALQLRHRLSGAEASAPCVTGRSSTQNCGSFAAVRRSIREHGGEPSSRHVISVPQRPRNIRAGDKRRRQDQSRIPSVHLIAQRHDAATDYRREPDCVFRPTRSDRCCTARAVPGHIALGARIGSASCRRSAGGRIARQAPSALRPGPRVRQAGRDIRRGQIGFSPNEPLRPYSKRGVPFVKSRSRTPGWCYFHPHRENVENKNRSGRWQCRNRGCRGKSTAMFA
jgi:hypothetical protein